MNEAACSIPDCLAGVRAKGLCYAHYMKAWRYGTPTPVHAPKWEDIAGRRFGQLVAVKREASGMWTCRCDCGSVTTVTIGSLNAATTQTCGDRTVHRRQDIVGYCGAHDRLEVDRGKAKEHACVDCGQQAEHWSYDHEDPDELIDLNVWRKPVAYSLDSDHYVPRCVRCHWHFDKGHSTSYRGAFAH